MAAFLWFAVVLAAGGGTRSCPILADSGPSPTTITRACSRWRPSRIGSRPRRAVRPVASGSPLPPGPPGGGIPGGSILGGGNGARPGPGGGGTARCRLLPGSPRRTSRGEGVICGDDRAVWPYWPARPVGGQSSFVHASSLDCPFSGLNQILSSQTGGLSWWTA